MLECLDVAPSLIRTLLASVLALSAMSAPAAEPPVAHAADRLVSDFVYGSLALSPVAATAAGYHQHRGKALDTQIDDYGGAGLGAARSFYRGLQRRASALANQTLDPERRADLTIMNNNISLALLDLEVLKPFEHNPTLYVELIGNALYNPYVLNYASKQQRFRHIIQRLQRVPALLSQARTNLRDAPEVWNRVAREESEGNIELIDHTLRAETPAELQSAYAAAAPPALQSLREFNSWLAGTLSQHPADWRLGKDNYQRKCGYVLATGRTTEQILAAAEADLQRTRAELMALAAPRTVPEALADVASRHPSADGFIAAARQSLSSATEFVRQRDLVTLPTNANLQVIETPLFMRGIYGVGGFNAAPALEPQLGAFYWITPIPQDWPQDRIDSKLREYNDYGLQHLTIHEAMPGHYVQLEYANQLQPVTRRLLRNIWGNGAYIEGWAVYTQQMMTEEGYLAGDVGLRFTLLKQLLRSEANTILDIRLHTLGMSDQQALDLMINDTYQEREEATAKLQRAQLSSCQLAMYYSGLKGWLEIRDHYRQRHPGSFSLRDFHERALRESAVPMPLLESLLP
jgi:uncharacterized protein (DUF885 family)